MSVDSITLEQVSRGILAIRGQKVLLDADLARLYGVSTGRLIEQVKRNRNRFPQDFLFRLADQELTNLTSQFAISSLPVRSWGGRRNAPYAFTEHGALMAATSCVPGAQSTCPYLWCVLLFGCATRWWHTRIWRKSWMNLRRKRSCWRVSMTRLQRPPESNSDRSSKRFAS